MLIDLDLIFDCETTGLKREGHIPDVVQLSAKLVIRKSGRVVDDITRIVKPLPGVAFEAEAVEHHKITERLAHMVGVPLTVVLADLKAMAESATAIVAHNIEYDRSIIMRACERVKANCSWWTKRSPIFRCSMELSTPVLKLPGNFGEYKFPSLEEAHHYFYPYRNWISEHDALGDRDACGDVWDALLERGIH